MANGKRIGLVTGGNKGIGLEISRLARTVGPLRQTARRRDG
jgi:hypothetical protein